MNVIARKHLVAFWFKHPETEQALRAWLTTTKGARWSSMDAIVRTYSKASPVDAERCVFDICGGIYRLVVAFKFSGGTAFIKFIGTHAAYDRIDAATISQF